MDIVIFAVALLLALLAAGTIYSMVWAVFRTLFK